VGIQDGRLHVKQHDRILYTRDTILGSR